MGQHLDNIRPAAFSIPEAAHQLSMSRSGVYQLIANGTLRRIKIGKRSLIPATELDRLLALPPLHDDANDFEDVAYPVPKAAE